MFLVILCIAVTPLLSSGWLKKKRFEKDNLSFLPNQPDIYIIINATKPRLLSALRISWPKGKEQLYLAIVYNQATKNFERT